MLPVHTVTEVYAMKRTGILIAAVFLTTAPAWAVDDSADSGDHLFAVWTDKELTYVYQGFTTRYSCDGLRDKIRGVLLDLGADKKTLKVLQLGCSSPDGRPDPFPGVRVKVKVVQPAGPNDTPTAQAHWKAI